MKSHLRDVLVATVALILSAGVVHADDPAQDPESVVVAALAAAPDIPGQATALANLAWPEGDVDPAVRAYARKMLVEYRAHGMDAIRDVIAHRADHSADAVAALIEARAITRPPIPAVYAVALDDALWFGEQEAVRLALLELGRFRGSRRVLSMMDAAEEYPDLVPVTIDTLGRVGDDHARFWLAKHLNEGDEIVSTRAAFALGSIGSRAFYPLVDAVRGDDRRIRETAARALAVSSTPDELRVLYEYLTDHPDDDPETLEAVRQRAELLEAELERRFGAPPEPGDS